LVALRPFAFQVGLVDEPGGRKTHGASVPLIGGAAMFAGFILPILLFSELPPKWLPFFSASALMVVIGVIDDMRPLPSVVRLATQVFAVLLVSVWGNVRLDNVGDLVGAGEGILGEWAVPFTVFAAMGVINAFNMTDGLDGLASGLALILFAFLGSLAAIAGMTTDLRVVFVLGIVVAIFFLCNFCVKNAWVNRVFMGDGGSMFLGLAIACLLIRFSQEPHQVIQPVTALWLFALPLMDTVSLMLRRVFHGRSPFTADLRHLHHVLLRAGFSAKQVVYVMLAVSFVMSSIGLLGLHFEVPEYVMFAGFMGLFTIYFFTLMRAWRVAKVIRREVHRARVARGFSE
ncbi:MAG: hypothetical protein U9R74_18340, partial [Pseudomonadota bacterium]|nr:hypothetical protein [Pseudomonadota bacterium]